jgi:hypothetical protein
MHAALLMGTLPLASPNTVGARMRAGHGSMEVFVVPGRHKKPGGHGMEVPLALPAGHT